MYILVLIYSIAEFVFLWLGLRTHLQLTVYACVIGFLLGVLIEWKLAALRGEYFRSASPCYRYLIPLLAAGIARAAWWLPIVSILVFLLIIGYVVRESLVINHQDSSHSV